MGRLSLTLLGAPEVRHAGRVVTFPTRKALALLAYLAAEGGRHSREKLTALFWPESDARHGRGALRTTLNHLRGVLEEETGESHLIVEHGAVGLNFVSDVDLDLHTLQVAFTLVRSSSRASREEPGSLPAPGCRRPLSRRFSGRLFAQRCPGL